jgi:ring-1,2-phenylacetyl-CoA epoxidase subunit PaaE
MPKITAMIGGQESVFDCDSSNTILEAALDEGVPAPFSCMAGACHVCMATVDSGEVDRGDDSLFR